MKRILMILSCNIIDSNKLDIRAVFILLSWSFIVTEYETVVVEFYLSRPHIYR